MVEQVKTWMMSCLRSVGQVFFQESALAGLVMLIGIGLNSLEMLGLCVVATVAAVAFAHLMKYPPAHVSQGLYGFNGALVGLAVGLYFEVSLVSILLMLIGVLISTLLTHLFMTRGGGRGYTFPFVLTVWGLLLIARACGVSPPISSEDVYVSEDLDLLPSLSFSFGQVMFQGKVWLTGILFFIALLVHSRQGAVMALLGAILALGTSLGLGLDVAAINSGLYGYNAILSAMALGDLSPRGIGRATIGVLISIFLQYLGLRLGYTTLTAPFVFSVWIMLLGERLMLPVKSNN